MKPTLPLSQKSNIPATGSPGDFIIFSPSHAHRSSPPLDFDQQLENETSAPTSAGYEEEDARRRKFTLTESNFISETNPKEILKENNPPPSEVSGPNAPLNTGVLSSAAEHYLKSLPDMSFMLFAPNVENGKE
jgi:hypothetical protein